MPDLHQVTVRADLLAAQFGHNSSMAVLLPLFPLALVAFPGNAVPLHIFEERYREMVGTAEADRTEFGIVLVKNGGLVHSGCTVQVEGGC